MGSEKEKKEVRWNEKERMEGIIKEQASQSCTRSTVPEIEGSGMIWEEPWDELGRSKQLCQVDQ